jgi:S1/P1 Nuclease
MRCILLATMFLASLCGNALAWGDTAHQVICELAFWLAKPATQIEIQRLINSDPAATFPDFSESCVLADHQRTRPAEHFLNLPRDSVGLSSDQCPLAPKCVLSAILSDLKIVASRNETDANRLFALESLGHWVGDIHQPLHVSFVDDRGGNTIPASGCTGARNLHAVWDSCLVVGTVGSDVVKASAGLMATITPEIQAQWSSTTPREWINETFAIAKAVTTHYCVMHGPSCDPSDESMLITSDYLKSNKPVVRQQLQKAAVRLAHLLDTALGN